MKIAIGIASLVCFIMVLIKMFQNGATTMAIVCIVGIFVCGIGGLVAFIYGWIKSREWNITTLMLVWTGLIVVGIVLNVVFPTQFQLPESP